MGTDSELGCRAYCEWSTHPIICWSSRFPLVFVRLTHDRIRGTCAISGGGWRENFIFSFVACSYVQTYAIASSIWRFILCGCANGERCALAIHGLIALYKHVLLQSTLSIRNTCPVRCQRRCRCFILMSPARGNVGTLAIRTFVRRVDLKLTLLAYTSIHTFRPE